MSRQWVLDASALLALLNDEIGGEFVAEAIGKGAVIGSVNLSEVVAKLNEFDIPEDDIYGIINRIRVEIVDFSRELAFTSGLLRLRTKEAGLSLGDRACLALAHKLGLPCLTADKTWKELQLPVEVHLIR